MVPWRVIILVVNGNSVANKQASTVFLDSIKQGPLLFLLGVPLADLVTTTRSACAIWWLNFVCISQPVVRHAIKIMTNSNFP